MNSGKSTNMAFPLKLYSIVNDTQNSNLISWNTSGDFFTIHNPHEFTERILSANIVKTSNYSSFVRQLNIYDFHKLKKTNNEKSESFKHKFFIKDKQPLLKLIKRKTFNSDNNTNLKTDLQLYSSPKKDLVQNNLQENNLCTQPDLSLKEESLINEAIYCEPKMKRTSKHNLHSIYSKFISDVSLSYLYFRFS